MNSKLCLAVGISLCGFTFLTGCNPPPETEEKPEAVKMDKLVARVASVNEAAGYVLIQRYGRLNVGVESILYTLSADGKTSSLKVTGERLGQFIAADIISGELNIGDAVYLRDLTEVESVKNKTELEESES